VIDDQIIAQGRNLFVSADNIRRTSADLDALWASMLEALEGQTFGGGVATEPKKRDSSYSTGWISSIYAQTFEIRKPPKKDGSAGKVISTISFAIRLCGNSDVFDEPVFPWLDQAALIVAWQPFDDEWAAEDFEADNAEHIKHYGQGLYGWGDDGPSGAHLYALPLFAMRTEKDIAAFVITPLETFLLSDNPAEEAASAFKGVPVLRPDQ
jgi:hypothetical protein